MEKIEKFIEHWDNLIDRWKKDSEDTIGRDVYFSKYRGNEEKSKLYINNSFSENVEFYKYLPEPYLGDPNNCCAVMLNLNPGFGIDLDVCKDDSRLREHPDYKFQHHDNWKNETKKYSDFALKFEPYLSDNIINGNQSEIKNGGKHPGGVYWWYGTYDDRSKKCTGGRIDYIEHLYNLWFGENKFKLQERKPFALELCPWHSHKFGLSDIITKKMKTKDNDLVRALKKYVLEPALMATQGNDVLPFVICIGKAITELCDVLDLKRVECCKWENGKKGDVNIDNWPINDKNDKQLVQRTYQLYECEINGNRYFLLNTYAPGSNKTPAKETFQIGVEDEIIKSIQKYIKKD